jgi:hypothetical protein
MVFKGAKGKIKLLRNNDLGHVWGPPDDAIYTEVTIVLEGVDGGFGFELRAGDDNLPSRLAMYSTLREAYINNLVVAIGYDIVEGKKNGHLRRVQLER